MEKNNKKNNSNVYDNENMEKPDKELPIFKTLMGQVKQYKKDSILTPLFMILEVAMEMVIPLLMASIIDKGVEAGLPEEELRYLKPQATAFKAIIGMNAHALLDWSAIRCCKNAQKEIRDLATKMIKLATAAAPDLFVGAGPSCVQLGYCPENSRQHPSCKARGIVTKQEAIEILEAYTLKK